MAVVRSIAFSDLAWAGPADLELVTNVGIRGWRMLPASVTGLRAGDDVDGVAAIGFDQHRGGVGHAVAVVDVVVAAADVIEVQVPRWLDREGTVVGVGEPDFAIFRAGGRAVDDRAARRPGEAGDPAGHPGQDAARRARAGAVIAEGPHWPRQAAERHREFQAVARALQRQRGVPARPLAVAIVPMGSA